MVSGAMQESPKGTLNYLYLLSATSIPATIFTAQIGTLFQLAHPTRTWQECILFRALLHMDRRHFIGMSGTYTVF